MNELTMKLSKSNITSLFTVKDLKNIGINTGNLKDLLEEAVMKQDIIHIKDDIYTLGGMLRKELICDELLAQKLVPNSYVSMEFVLSKIAWIPEAVYVTISVTDGADQRIKTNFGNYRYYNIKQRTYMAGVKEISRGKNSYLQATPLKALADIICRRGYDWTTVYPLLESFRIEYDDLETLTGADFDEVQGSYGIRNVEEFLAGIRKELAL